MYKDTTKELFDFIDKSPCVAHAVNNAALLLEETGFERLHESKEWKLKPGGKYFFTRGLKSIAAFTYPKADFLSYMVVAPHGDSPCFRIKESPEMSVMGEYTNLNTEIYGGTPLHLWLDRPLSIAGTIMTRQENAVKAKLVDFKNKSFVIPSLAIHHHHDVNNGFKWNPQTQVLPLFCAGNKDIKEWIADETGIDKEDILNHELYLYSAEKPFFHGANDEFAAAPRLDDLQCVFSALKAFVSTYNNKNVNIFMVFDNEEIGSMTRRGADSDLLSSLIARIALAAGKNADSNSAAIAGGFMLSADNGHALHPLYPEKTDPTNRCILGKGPLVKINPRYATDVISAAVFEEICAKAKVPVQRYFNRSDVSGGSTLGNISTSHVSLQTADIGAPQLSMHSPVETTGTTDTLNLIKVMQEFYASEICWQDDETFEVKRADEAKNWENIASF